MPKTNTNPSKCDDDDDDEIEIEIDIDNRQGIHKFQCACTWEQQRQIRAHMFTLFSRIRIQRLHFEGEKLNLCFIGISKYAMYDPQNWLTCNDAPNRTS